jgi:CrcB protein
VNVLLVAAGGALGAVLRYLLDGAVRRRFGPRFPWGTLLVNVTGSALLGVLTGWALGGGAPDALRLLAGVGLCGALTTFSTFGYDTVRLLTERGARYAAGNVVLTVPAGFLAAGAGLALALTLSHS